MKRLAFSFLLTLFLPVLFAATPLVWHPAEQIKPGVLGGDFGGGDFRVNGSLNISNVLSAYGDVRLGDDALYVKHSSFTERNVSTLSASWNISAAQYLTKLGGSSSSLYGIFFSPDGLRMFIVRGGTTPTVDEFGLSAPWDILSVTSTVKSVDVDDSYPKGLYFSPDGLRMFVVGAFSGEIYSFVLSSPWSFVGGVSSSSSLYVSSVDDTPVGVFFSPDGLKMFLVGSENDRVYQFDLSTAWDVSTASYTGKWVDVNDAYPGDVFFSNDGLRMFVTGGDNVAIYVYNLSVPWDLSTANFVYSSSLSEMGDIFGIFFSENGVRMFLTSRDDKEVYSYYIGLRNSTFLVQGEKGSVCINGLCDESFSLSVGGGGSSAALFVGHPYGVYGFSNKSGGWGIYCSGVGASHCGGTEGWTVSSDVRVKENVTVLVPEGGVDGFLGGGSGGVNSSSSSSSVSRLSGGLLSGLAVGVRVVGSNASGVVNGSGLVGSGVGGSVGDSSVGVVGSVSVKRVDVLSKVRRVRPLVYRKDSVRLKELELLNRLYRLAGENDSLKKVLVEKGVWDKLVKSKREKWDPQWADVLLEDDDVVRLLNMSRVVEEHELDVLLRGLNGSSSDSGDVEVGFAAQDLMDVFPEVVVWDEATGTWGITYSELIPFLFLAVQELDRRVSLLDSSAGWGGNATVALYAVNASRSAVADYAKNASFAYRALSADSLEGYRLEDIMQLIDYGLEPFLRDVALNESAALSAWWDGRGVNVTLTSLMENTSLVLPPIQLDLPPLRVKASLAGGVRITLFSRNETRLYTLMDGNWTWRSLP